MYFHKECIGLAGRDSLFCRVESAAFWCGGCHLWTWHDRNGGSVPDNRKPPEKRICGCCPKGRDAGKPVKRILQIQIPDLKVGDTFNYGFIRVGGYKFIVMGANIGSHISIIAFPYNIFLGVVMNIKWSFCQSCCLANFTYSNIIVPFAFYKCDCCFRRHVWQQKPLGK